MTGNEFDVIVVGGPIAQGINREPIAVQPYGTADSSATDQATASTT